MVTCKNPRQARQCTSRVKSDKAVTGEVQLASLARTLADAKSDKGVASPPGSNVVGDVSGISCGLIWGRKNRGGGMC